MEKTIDYKKLARSLMFEISDKEEALIAAEFEYLQKHLSLLNDVDTTDVKEMVYPFETPTSYLRKDVVNHIIEKEDALLNAKNIKQGYFVVPKVVK